MKLYGTESNESIIKEVGNRIRETRISVSITQQEMAFRAYTVMNRYATYCCIKKISGEDIFFG